MRRLSSPSSICVVAALLVTVLLWSGVSSPALAQLSVSVNGGVNLLWEDEFAYYLPVGFNAALEGQIPVTPWMLLDPALTYRVYPFWRDPGLVSTDLSANLVSAEPLQQLWIGLALRLQIPSDSHKVVPFLDLAAGYECERVGRLTVDRGLGLYTTVSNPIYLRDWAYTAAAGLRIWLSTRFSLEPSYRWHTRGRYRNYGLLSFDLIYALPL